MFFSAKFCPFFWVFRVPGPITIASRACERSNDGPEDPKYPKKRAKRGRNEHFSTQQQKCQKPKNFNATYCFVAFLSYWQKTICKVLYPSLNHYSLPKLKVTSYRKYMRGAKVMTYLVLCIYNARFCKNKPGDPSLIQYIHTTQYLYYLYNAA